MVDEEIEKWIVLPQLLEKILGRGGWGKVVTSYQTLHARVPFGGGGLLSVRCMSSVPREIRLETHLFSFRCRGRPNFPVE